MASTTIQDIFTCVQENLAEAGAKWHTEDSILAAIQDAYNYAVSLLRPIQRTTFIPKLAHPYYPIRQMLPDFMYLTGIYNPATNLWLMNLTEQRRVGSFQTYLDVGEPRFYKVVDFNRITIWPHLTTPTGALFLSYKASAPAISFDHVPILPLSVAKPLLEYLTMAFLLEQPREFSKAIDWANKVFTPPGSRSLFKQAEREISNLAAFSTEQVLEPYRWIFHGGSQGAVTWINNETPVGTIDGSNAIFTIAAVPSPTSSLILTKNGQILYNTIGYTLSGSTITFNTIYIPQTGDSLRAWYQIN